MVARSLNSAVFSLLRKIYLSLGIPLLLLVLLSIVVLFWLERVESIHSTSKVLANGLTSDIANFDRWTASSRLKSLSGNTNFLEIDVKDKNGVPFSSFSQNPNERHYFSKNYFVIYKSLFVYPILDKNRTKWGDIFITVDWTESIIISFCIVFMSSIFYFLVGMLGNRLLSSRLGQALDELDIIIEGVKRVHASADSDAHLEGNIVEFKDRILEIKYFEEAKKLGSDIFDLLESLLEARKDAIKSAEYRSIANTTQMLAHDIRKPFSLLKASISHIGSCTSIEEIDNIVPTVKLEVEKSLVSVEGMIQDILELGKETNLVLADVSPCSLVKDALGEVSQIHPNCDIHIDYNWSHNSLAHVDELRVRRIFSNIFHNAIQAMNSAGKIWISTCEESTDFIEFTIKNSDSYIPEESISEIFSAFYTKGKKAGTGLGLAIAKKITEAHGGSICVESSKVERTVEFKFSLPKSNLSDGIQQERMLPTKIKDFLFNLGVSDQKKQVNSERLQNLLSMFKSLMKNRKFSAINIALIDDEKLYRDGIESLVSGTEISDMIRFTQFEGADDFFMENPSKFEFVVCDIDLNDQHINGIDIVRKLSGFEEFKGAVCVHSNRTLTENFSEAAAAGAKGFQPKPMMLDHLLKFIVDSFPVSQVIPEAPPVTEVASRSECTLNKPIIAFVDDSELLRGLYSSMIRDAVVLAFSAPEEFLTHCQSNPEVFNQISYVITDDNFGSLSQTRGVGFAMILRKMSYSGKVVLFSDGVFDDDQLALFDFRVSKAKIHSFEELEKHN